MTIHTSKGLEYPYVCLCGFSDGILPSAMSIKERRKRAIEEERRLTYVAITRAEKSFYLTEAEGFNYSTGEQRYPSRFLFDLKESLYVQKGEIDKMYMREAKHHMTFENNRLEEIEIFNVGDFVTHPVWKLGEIKEVNNDKGEYSIFFIESQELKPINFEYSQLRKETEIFVEKESNLEVLPEPNTNLSDLKSVENVSSKVEKEIIEGHKVYEKTKPEQETVSEKKGFWNRLKHKLTGK